MHLLEFNIALPVKKSIARFGFGYTPKYWNNRRECISDNLPEIYGSPSELNQRLNHELRKAEDIISLAFKRRETPLAFFKLYYKPDQSFECIINEIEITGKEKILDDIFLNKDIYFQIDDYIKAKAKKVSTDMPRIYRNMIENPRYK